MTLLELGARVEAAEEISQDVLLIEAYHAIHGIWPGALDGRQTDHSKRFRKMIDAEAWTSAAEMLVPVGWFPDIVAHEGGGNVRLYKGQNCTDITRATTPALALLAACLKAHGGGE